MEDPGELLGLLQELVEQSLVVTRVDADGRVTYASPNGLSVYRKLGLIGDLTGQFLTDLTRELVPARWRPDEETLT